MARNALTPKNSTLKTGTRLLLGNAKLNKALITDRKALANSYKQARRSGRGHIIKRILQGRPAYGGRGGMVGKIGNK